MINVIDTAEVCFQYLLSDLLRRHFSFNIPLIKKHLTWIRNMRSLSYQGKWLNYRPREKKWNLIRSVLISGLKEYINLWKEKEKWRTGAAKCILSLSFPVVSVQYRRTYWSSYLYHDAWWGRYSIICGKTVAKHDLSLQTVFKTIAESGLKLNVLNEKKREIHKLKYATLET